MTAPDDAAVAAVFARVPYLTLLEIDAQHSGFCTFTRDRARHPRARVLAAAREVNPGRQARLTKANSTDASEWYRLILMMLFRITSYVNSKSVGTLTLGGGTYAYVTSFASAGNYTIKMT